MKAEIKTITPEIAAEMLRSNTSNRPLTDRHVLFLSNQMVKGKWLYNGESIKFSKNGVLLDGQHRLTALIKSGKTIDMLVIHGLEEEAFNVIDTGRTRTAGDVLGKNGYSSSISLGASCRFLIMIARGGYSQDSKKALNITNQDVLDLVEKNPDIAEAMTFSQGVYIKNRQLPKSIIGGLYYLFSKKNAIKAEEFWTGYSTGIDLPQGNPVLMLRTKLMQDSINKSRMSTREKVFLTIAAWNAFVLNKTIAQLRTPTELPNIL